MFYFLAIACSNAFAEKRVALVVGNSAYQSAPALPNPVNDAEDVAVALEAVGFDVIHATNVNLQDFRSSIRQFAASARHADVTLFYFSGHGMQWDGENMLIPTDARFADANTIPFEVLPLSDVMTALSLAGKVKILILDACRDNDAERALKTALAEERGKRATNIDRGLVKLEASRGQVVVYATQPNQTASDAFGESSRNSPFTYALLQTIRQPGLEIGRTFRKVAAKVDELTNGTQLPEISMSLLGDFYFVSGQGDEGAGRLARLENTAVSRSDSQPNTTFDGRWEITVDGRAGCSDNGKKVYPVLVKSGRVNEPTHKVPKRGVVTKGGHLRVDLVGSHGKIISTVEAIIKGNLGRGRMSGVTTQCTGDVIVRKLD